MLNDGTVIHWPPHLESRFKGTVDKGDEVSVVGSLETDPKKATHLEVQSLTNVRTKNTVSNDDAPLAPPRREVGPREGNRDQRLQMLQEQLDQLQRELDGLRRDR